MGDGVGWDTHRDNFPRTRALSLECDAAMAALVTAVVLAMTVVLNFVFR